jgi:hypothetical protein
VEAVGLGQPLGHLSGSQAVGIVPHWLESSAYLVDDPLDLLGHHQAGGSKTREKEKKRQELGEASEERESQEGGGWERDRGREGPLGFRV